MFWGDGGVGSLMVAGVTGLRTDPNEMELDREDVRESQEFGIGDVTKQVGEWERRQTFIQEMGIGDVSRQVVG